MAGVHHRANLDAGEIPELEQLALTLLFAAMDALTLAGHTPDDLVMTTVGHAAEAVDRRVDHGQRRPPLDVDPPRS